MMATNDKNCGTFTLPRTALALWVSEVSGQISDGMWENSRPNDHFKFWHRLTLVLGPVASLAATRQCRKNNYALTRLPQLKWDPDAKMKSEYVLRDRMLAAGRMAKAGADPLQRDLLTAGEYMPPTLAAFRLLKDSFTGVDLTKNYIARYVCGVSDELAQAFYAATYTLKEMYADLKLIKATMATAPKSWW